jgi:sec-independent protein translocase protein TatA
MFGLGIPEIVIIIVVFAILFFGGKKVGELAKGMGRFTGEYKKGKMDIERELKEAEQRKI